MSVDFINDSEQRDTNVPNTGDWTQIIIGKIPDYTAGDFIQGISIARTDGLNVVGFDTDETGTNTFDAFVYGGGFQAVEIAPSGYTGWFMGAITHASGSANYPAYKWLAGDTVVTSAGTLTTGMQLTSLGRINVSRDEAASPQAIRIYKVRVLDTVLDAAQLLSYLQNAASFDGSADNTLLELASAATAGTNEGTGGNFTVNGTPADNADNPTLPSAGGGGAGRFFFGAAAAMEARA